MQKYSKGFFQKVRELIKGQFVEINEALFNNNITIEYLFGDVKVNADGATLFQTKKYIHYYQNNFKYFYELFIYITANVDLVNLSIVRNKYDKLKVDDDILLIKFTNQIKETINDVRSIAHFVEYNLIANLFIFLHECGHLN